MTQVRTASFVGQEEWGVEQKRGRLVWLPGNDKCQMPNDEGSSNDKWLIHKKYFDLDFGNYFVICHSSFSFGSLPRPASPGETRDQTHVKALGEDWKVAR
jgi:hypothetical protein